MTFVRYANWPLTVASNRKRRLVFLMLQRLTRLIIAMLPVMTTTVGKLKKLCNTTTQMRRPGNETVAKKNPSATAGGTAINNAVSDTFIETAMIDQSCGSKLNNSRNDSTMAADKSK